MTQRYAEPSAFKRALEDRLRRRAKESNEELGRLRQRFIFERFLARVVAQFGDRAVVKGGIALQLRIESARTTRDVDLRMSGDPSRLIYELRQAGQLLLDRDFLTFTVEPDTRHPTIEGEGVLYEGQRFRVEASLAGKIYGSRFGLDVGFGDPMTHPPEIVPGSDLFAFAEIPRVSVRVYARLPWATLHDLTTAVRAFLDPVLRGEDGVWDPATWVWRRGA